MIYFYCTSWQFFQMIVKWRISPTTEQIMFTFSILLFHFYSHIPYGMWRIPKLKHFVLLRFLLTHPVWDVTGIPTDITPVWTNFYSHIPCGMWHGMGGHSHSISEFLLTHPVWDVTLSYWCFFRQRKDFYSHIPCGMWLFSKLRGNCIFHFYSHIPCGMWRNIP